MVTYTRCKKGKAGVERSEAGGSLYQSVAFSCFLIRGDGYIIIETIT